MEATSEVPQLDWDMVILRPTRKLNSLLPATEVIPTSSDTALGDWYVNRVVVDRQPLLLLVSSTSLLPMLIPAQNVRGLPARLAALVEARLRRCGLDDRTIAAETLAMASVAVGPTVDRSVLGIMVDFAKAVPYHLEPGAVGGNHPADRGRAPCRDSVPRSALLGPRDISGKEGTGGSAGEVAGEHTTAADAGRVVHCALGIEVGRPDHHA